MSIRGFPHHINMILMLESIFPMLKGKIELDDVEDKISFSVLVEDESELCNMYEKLYSLEENFKSQGYEMLTQDDNEYFGCMLSR